MMNAIRILRFGLAVLLVGLTATKTLAGPGDGTVLGATKIADNGPNSLRWNLVVIAEGFTISQQGSFNVYAQRVVDEVYDRPQLQPYIPAINVFRLNVASAQSGADDPDECGGTDVYVNTYFDASFCGDGVNRRALVANDALCINVLNTWVPEWDQAVVLVNDTVYGGTGGTIAVSSVAEGWREVFVHELGHSAFGLGDEYEYWVGPDVYEPGQSYHPPYEPAVPNTTIQTNRSRIKWRDLISTTLIPTTRNNDCAWPDPQPNPLPDATVGLYEGADYYHCHAYRPRFNCLMRVLYYDFCPVCLREVGRVLTPYMPYSVEVESKSVDVNATGVTIGISLKNDVSLMAYEIPLVLRTTSGGAFITNMKRSYPAGTRLDGKITDVSIINLYDGNTVGACKSGQSGGYTGEVNQVQDVFFPVVASPEAVVFARVGFFESNALPAGTDGSNPQMLLTVDINDSVGTFEIDTTCTDPDNHLVFVDLAYSLIIPNFTKGVITVDPNAPPVAVDDSYLIPEDNPTPVAAPGVLTNDTDADGDPLTAVLVAGVSYGSLTLNANGGFVYRPAANYNGPDTFTYRARDATAYSNVATVSITVYPVNDAPVARDTSWATNQDTPKPVTYLPASDPDGDILTFSILTAPLHGVISGFSASTGAFTYTPTAGYSGADSLKFKVSDPGALCDTGTVRITVLSFANSVAVESRTVPAGATGVTIGISVKNDVSLGTYVIPLVLRTTSGGAFITNMKRSFPSGTRLDGKLTDINIINLYDGNTAGACKSGQSGGYTGAVNQVQDVFFPVVSSPEAVMFVRVNIVGTELPAGADGASPQMSLTVDVNGSSGTFEIDTTCTDPADNHLAFVDVATSSLIIPTFTKGVVTINPCACPRQGDINGDGFMNVLDVVAVINRVFKGAARVQDPFCPRERADFNANGVINVLDVIGEINRVFKGGPLPVDPCGP